MSLDSEQQTDDQTVLLSSVGSFSPTDDNDNYSDEAEASLVYAKIND